MGAVAGEQLRAVSDCVDRVRASLRAVDDSEIVQALRDIELLSRTMQSVMLDVVAEIEARRIATREGFGTTARLLAGMLRLSAGEARTRVEHAGWVGGGAGATGAGDRSGVGRRTDRHRPVCG